MPQKAACPCPLTTPHRRHWDAPQQHPPPLPGPVPSVTSEENIRTHPGEATSPGRRLFLSSGRHKDALGFSSVDVTQEYVALFF